MPKEQIYPLPSGILREPKVPVSLAPLRVGIVCGAGYVSGKEVVTLDLALGLRQLGYYVCLLTGHPAWTDGDFRSRLLEHKLPHRCLRLGFISKTLRLRPIYDTLNQLVHLPGAIRGFRRWLREESPDVVIHTNWHHAFLLSSALRVDRDIYVSHEGFEHPRRFDRHIFAALSRRIGRFVGVSAYVACTLKQLGVPQYRVATIHNGIEFYEAENAPLAGERTEPVRMGIVGQIGPWKGHEDLIEAMGLLRHEGVKLTLRVFGRGDSAYIEQLQRRSRELKVADAIEWCGFERDRRQIYKGIDFLVVASRFAEPFGMVVVEAARAGVPAVVTQRGGLPEIVIDDLTGWVCNPSDPRDLATKIRSALDAPRRESAGNAAWHRARTHFGIENMSMAYAKLATELVDSRTIVAQGFSRIKWGS